MPTIRLTGGVGNQLFQYATGRCLSEQTSSQLKIDITNYEHGSKRLFRLNEFNTCGKVVKNGHIKDKLNVAKMKLSRKLKKIDKKLPVVLLQLFEEEDPFLFDKYVLNLPDKIYLVGFYQSEKYFREIKSKIQNEVSLSSDIGKRNEKWIKKINEGKSVSVHVRRGDYKEVGRPTKKRYVNKSVEFLKSKDVVENLFFFSDEIEWVKKNIEGLTPVSVDKDNVYIVTCNQKEGYKDIILMKKCDHNIITSSTFSWWGAWLNTNPGKIVVAPKYWLGRNTKRIDIVPKSWTKIDNR